MDLDEDIMEETSREELRGVRENLLTASNRLLVRRGFGQNQPSFTHHQDAGHCSFVNSNYQPSYTHNQGGSQTGHCSSASSNYQPSCTHNQGGSQTGHCSSVNSNYQPSYTHQCSQAHQFNSPSSHTRQDALPRGFWNVSSKTGKRNKSSTGKSKRKKIPMWTHTFVCLSSREQEEVPDCNLRADLQMAGLGEKRISLPDYSDGYDIHIELTTHFPKLNNAGGYELLRLQEGGGKQLDIIACPPSGYSVAYLKAVVHTAKIYIRPLQKDLSLDQLEDKVSFFCTTINFLFKYACVPKEKCMQCGTEVLVTSLKEHLLQCSVPKYIDLICIIMSYFLVKFKIKVIAIQGLLFPLCNYTVMFDYTEM